MPYAFLARTASRSLFSPLNVGKLPDITCRVFFFTSRALDRTLLREHVLLQNKEETFEVNKLTFQNGVRFVLYLSSTVRRDAIYDPV